jgi:hypothetical protein
MTGGAEAQQTNETVKNRLVRGVEGQVLDDSELVTNSTIKYIRRAGTVPSEM